MGDKCLDSIQKCGIFGVSQVMAQIKGASVVIHGPKGCVFPAYEASIADSLNISYTEMCRKSTVFGGERDAIEKVKDEYYESLPEIMAIITTCASEIIGDDINGIINSANLEIPVISIEGGSFNNSQLDGLNIAMLKIVKSLCKKCENVENIINIFGTVGRSYTWKADANHLSELLQEFGVHARALFLDTNVQEISTYSNARLNVIIDKNYGIPCAEYMKETFGIPYIVADYPLGIKNTEMFIQSILKALGSFDIDTETFADYRKNVKSTFRTSLGRVNTFRMFEEIRKLKKVIIEYEEPSAALLQTLVNELENNVDCIIVKENHLEDKQYFEKRIHEISPKTQVFVTNDRNEIIEYLRDHKFEVVLGSDVEYYAIEDKKSFAYVNIEYPGARELHIKPKYYVGYQGMLNFVEDYYNKIINMHIF